VDSIQRMAATKGTQLRDHSPPHGKQQSVGRQFQSISTRAKLCPLPRCSFAHERCVLVAGGSGYCTGKVRMVRSLGSAAEAMTATTVSPLLQIPTRLAYSTPPFVTIRGMSSMEHSAVLVHRRSE